VREEGEGEEVSYKCFHLSCSFSYPQPKTGKPCCSAFFLGHHALVLSEHSPQVLILHILTPFLCVSLPRSFPHISSSYSSSSPPSISVKMHKRFAWLLLVIVFICTTSCAQISFNSSWAEECTQGKKKNEKEETQSNIILVYFSLFYLFELVFFLP
jgi:hypothetical protein